MTVAPCPMCGSLKYVVCEVDEQAGTDQIRCTKCRKRGPPAPWSATATDPPGSLDAWNRFATQQPTLF